MAGRPAGRSAEEKGQRWGNTLKGQSAAFQGFRDKKYICSWCFSVLRSAIRAFSCVKQHGSHETVDCPHHLWLNLSFAFSRSLTTNGSMWNYLQPHGSGSAGTAPPAEGLLCRSAQHEELGVDPRRPINSKDFATSFHLRTWEKTLFPQIMIYVAMRLRLSHIQLFSVRFKPHQHILKIWHRCSYKPPFLSL